MQTSRGKIANGAEYHMTYYSGGGTAYDGGCWILTKRPKSIKFVCIDKPFFEPNIPYDFSINTNSKERTHCLRDWGDGSYTVYPFQSGVPHIFEPASLARQFSIDDDCEDLTPPKQEVEL